MKATCEFYDVFGASIWVDKKGWRRPFTLGCTKIKRLQNAKDLYMAPPTDVRVRGTTANRKPLLHGSCQHSTLTGNPRQLHPRHRHHRHHQLPAPSYIPCSILLNIYPARQGTVLT